MLRAGVINVTPGRQPLIQIMLVTFQQNGILAEDTSGDTHLFKKKQSKTSSCRKFSIERKLYLL